MDTEFGFEFKPMTVSEIVERGEVDEFGKPYEYYRSEAFYHRGNEIETLQHSIVGLQMNAAYLADKAKQQNKQLKEYEKEVRSLLQAGR